MKSARYETFHIGIKLVSATRVTITLAKKKLGHWQKCCGYRDKMKTFDLLLKRPIWTQELSTQSGFGDENHIDQYSTILKIPLLSLSNNYRVSQKRLIKLAYHKSIAMKKCIFNLTFESSVTSK